MIITDTFVYIHYPKTGGTFVSEMLKQLAQKSPDMTCYEVPNKKHSGVSQIPKEHRHKKVVMNVRNTFDHYVSRYKFGWWGLDEPSSRMFHMSLVRRDFPNFPDLRFNEFMTLFNSWHYRRNKQVERWESLLTENEIGLNSWVLARLALPNPVRLIRKFDDYSPHELSDAFFHIQFLRTERLNEDLVSLLQTEGHSRNDLEFILGADIVLPKLGGRAKSDPWWEYFDEPMIKDVLRRDRLYFRLFPDMVPVMTATAE